MIDSAITVIFTISRKVEIPGEDLVASDLPRNLAQVVEEGSRVSMISRGINVGDSKGGVGGSEGEKGC